MMRQSTNILDKVSILARYRHRRRVRQHRELCKINVRALEKIKKLEQKRSELSEETCGALLSYYEATVKRTKPKIEALRKEIEMFNAAKRIEKELLRTETAKLIDKKEKKLEFRITELKRVLPKEKKELNVILAELENIGTKLKEYKWLYKSNLIDKSKYKEELRALKQERKRLKAVIKRKKENILYIEALGQST